MIRGSIVFVKMVVFGYTQVGDHGKDNLLI